MSATQEAMTDLSSANSTYLSTSVEEPELGSIDFRQSLRFFQEQLIVKNKGFTSPCSNRLTSNDGSKFSINFTDESKSESHLYTGNKNGVFDDGHKSLKNCKISIPTVDTILESVRVLRAIQKSQEQRGSSWSLNITNPDSDTSLQYLHILANSSKDKNGSISDDISEEDETIPMPQNNESQNGEIDYTTKKCTFNGNVDTEHNSVMKTVADEIPSFWPRNNIKQEIISNGIPVEITKDFEEINLNITNSGNEDTKPQSLSKLNSLLDTGISDSKNIGFIFNKNSGELVYSIDGTNKLGEDIVSNILNGCNSSQLTNEDLSTINLSNGTDLPTNSTFLGEISNGSKDSGPENFQKYANTNTHTEVISFLEESSNEISKLGQNFPDISRIYRISWDSIDSSSATNSSLNEESSNKDSIIDSNCVEISQMDTTTCTGELEQMEINCKKECEQSKESLITEDNTLANENALQKITNSESDNRILKVISSLSPMHNEHLRPGSVSDTCSSIYVSAECSPCASFYEASEDNDPTYSNQFVENEGKKEICETWTHELAGQTKQNEPREQVMRTSESTSSTSDCNNLDNSFLVQKSEDETISPVCETTEFSDKQNEPGTGARTSATSNNGNILDNCLFIQKPEEITISHDVRENTENNEDINSQLQSDKIINPLNVSNNSSKISNSTSEVVTEINEELGIKLENEETCDIINSNVCDDNNLDNLNQPLLAVSEYLAPSGLTDTSNEDGSPETIMCSSKTITITNGNIPEKDTKEKDDYHEKENAFEKTLKSEETNIIHGVKKFTTSSWNLEAIMDSLYTLPDPSASKAFQEEEIFQTEVFIISQGAFCNYPEGNYTVTLEQQTLQITQESETNDLLTIPLNYGEVLFTDRMTLKLDNKLGRCLYFKFSTHEELLQLKEALQIHCQTQWESECINLVHYPLKCHQNVVIVDLGSCSTRAGILMDEPTLPFIFFPSVCATDKVTGNHVYGKEALQAEVRQNSILSFPIRSSIKIIKHSIDINLVEGLFKKIFQDLRVDHTQYTIQVCLPRSLSISAQNALVKLLLDDFKVQSVSLTHQALLTLYAHNVSTGIVVDVGDRMDILPVVDGFIVENGVTRLPYGGQRLIHHMKHALAEKHISLSNDIDAFVVQYIAENLSYIAENYDDEIEIATQYPDVVRKSIALQTFAKDSNCVEYASLDDARFKIPEGLFKPELWGLDNPGIHKLVQKAIQATSVDVRKKIAENIYVSGGVTLTPGFVERLIKEVAHLNKPRITPKVIASNYRYHSTYIGACKFAKMEVFPKVCVNLEEYSKNQLSSLKKFVLCF